MKGAYIVTEGDLTLREITPETAYEARVKIQCRVDDPAVRALLTEIIQPNAYSPTTTGPSSRRAAPRHGISA